MKDKKKKNILILGASSFVGVYVVNELMQSNIMGGGNFSLIGTGRNPRFKEYYDKLNIPYIKVDLRNKEDLHNLDAYEIDAIVLLAVRMPANVVKDDSYDDLAEYYQENVIATCDILEYCRKRKINRLVTFGSRFDTRLYPQGTVITEETPLNFSYTDDHVGYVLTNLSKQQVMHYYNEKYGMKNVILRIPSIFGVGPHGTFSKDGVVRKSGLQIFIDKAQAGEDIEVYGDSNTKKDLLYVKDLALAVRLVLESETAKDLYNVGYADNFRLEEIAKGIVEVYSPEGHKSKVTLRPDIPNNGGFPVMDCSKLIKETGYEPRYSNIVDMMRDYKQVYDEGVITKLFNLQS